MKLQHTTHVGPCKVAIYRDASTREYVVHSTVKGRRDSGYFTEDKADARGTAAFIVRRLRRSPACKRR